MKYGPSHFIVGMVNVGLLMSKLSTMCHKMNSWQPKYNEWNKYLNATEC